MSHNEAMALKIGEDFEKKSFVDVCRIITGILLCGLISLQLQASELERCLNFATSQEHRLEKEDMVRTCFDKYKFKLEKADCYSFLNKKIKSLDSTKLNEDITSICFYETSQPLDINTCLTESKKFKSSYNHNEAVFYCYQQFQEKLSKPECLKTANQLIFPLKKEYLSQHCNNNAN